MNDFRSQNGIDAACIALGQDWRAIEAASHAYASRSGRYQALTKYWLEKAEDGRELFCGELELPLAVGTKGGVLKTHPTYGYNLHMAGNPDANALARILCCVGLAQNFAALRALTTEGIQRGHLSLHSRNIAIAAGAPPHAVAEVTAYMIETNRMTIEAAKQYLTAHEILGIVRERDSPLEKQDGRPSPSMFYFEEESSSEDPPATPGVNVRVTFNIAFDTWSSAPNYLEYTADTEPTSVTSTLFGQRTYLWLSELMKLVSRLEREFSGSSSTRRNKLEIRKLKTMSIVINVLARRLMSVAPEETFSFVEDYILGESKFREKGKLESLSRPRAQSQPRSRSGSVADISARLAALHQLVPPQVDSYVTEILEDRRTTSSAPKSKRDAHMASEYEVDWHFASDLSIIPEETFPLEGASEEKRLVINVGFPLLFAMLQVFQLIVTQRVGQPSLISLILEEQRRVLASIVAKPLDKACSSPADFESFFDIHATRFQLTLLTLLEAAVLDEATINDTVLQGCKALGKALDIVTKAHDVARLDRDGRLAGNKFALDGSLANQGVVNSFAMFAASHGIEPSTLLEEAGDGTRALTAKGVELRDEFLKDGPSVATLSAEARDHYFLFKPVLLKHYGLAM